MPFFRGARVPRELLEYAKVGVYIQNLGSPLVVSRQHPGSEFSKELDQVNSAIFAARNVLAHACGSHDKRSYV